jgi:DNA-binding beta-propeller fold protein YncE
MFRTKGVDMRKSFRGRAAGVGAVSALVLGLAGMSSDDGGYDMYGPSGIVIAPSGRLFVTDYGGERVLSWPNADALTKCEPADIVIGAGDLLGPEALALDSSGNLYVADTNDHTVKIFKPNAEGTAYSLSVTLGTPGTAGDGDNQFDYPRGLAIGPGGTLFVADDYNNRVLMFTAPFSNGESASDSVGAGDDGGFDHPKAVAVWGNSLFVADYDNSRVLRFTGPFDTPDQVYKATATFTGVDSPSTWPWAPAGRCT